MATSSILGNVNIKGRKSSRTFACALMESKYKSGKKVQISKDYREVSGKAIKNLFK